MIRKFLTILTHQNKIEKGDLLFVAICLAMILIIAIVPTGLEQAGNSHIRPVKAKVLAVDNSSFHIIGLTRTGEQVITVEIMAGPHKGEQYDYYNHFLGKLDFDKVYEPGDKVLTVLQMKEGKVTGVQVMDRYRITTEAVLMGLFILFLLAYAGWTGLKAIVSFGFSVLMIIKILLPGYLHYINPLLLALGVTTVLTAVIIFLVAGFSAKGLTAFLGALTGVILTGIMAVVFGRLFRIPGEIQPFSELLLYSGYINMNLTDIYLAGIFISASGAVMDLSMDVAASMQEIKIKKPDISAGELILSGFSVGRSVIGTMTTTLLLAYAGGFSTIMMVFLSQGVSFRNIINIQYVAAEILHTVTGSFGLVSVAPLTAVIGGLIIGREKINTVSGLSGKA